MWTSRTIRLTSWGKGPVFMQVNEGTGVDHHPVTLGEDRGLLCFAYCRNLPLLQPFSLWEEVTAANQSHCPRAPRNLSLGLLCLLERHRQSMETHGVTTIWSFDHLKFWIVSSYRSWAPLNSLYSSFICHISIVPCLPLPCQLSFGELKTRAVQFANIMHSASVEWCQACRRYLI